MRSIVCATELDKLLVSCNFPSIVIHSSFLGSSHSHFFGHVRYAHTRLLAYFLASATVRLYLNQVAILISPLRTPPSLTSSLCHATPLVSQSTLGPPWQFSLRSPFSFLRYCTMLYHTYCTISINSTSHASQGPILVEIRPLVTGHGGRGWMGSPSAYPIWAWHTAARPKLVEIPDHVTVTGPCGRTCPPKPTYHGSHPRLN